MTKLKVCFLGLMTMFIMLWPTPVLLKALPEPLLLMRLAIRSRVRLLWK